MKLYSLPQSEEAGLKTGSEEDAEKIPGKMLPPESPKPKISDGEPNGKLH